MAALASALAARGHRAIVIGQPDMGGRLPESKIEFYEVGRKTQPPGSLAETERWLGRPRSPIGIWRTIGRLAETTDMLTGEGEAAVRRLQIDAIVTDQLTPAGALIAEHLGLPYVSVANALLLNREPEVPPVYTGWRYDPSDWGRRRNRGGYRIADLLMRPVGAVIASWCQRWHLPLKHRLEDCLSPYAQITQTVPGFDFPRRALLDIVHSCGPLRDEDRAGDLVLSDTGGRPLVYATLGTLQGKRVSLFHKIAEACRRLDLALLIAHGGRLSDAEAAALPGNPIVRAWVPQRTVLRHAALAVSNAGLNTVLDALACAVPVVALPIAFEQRATAARLEHVGAGVSLRALGLRTARLARTLDAAMQNEELRKKTAVLAAEITAARGAPRAAEIVERVSATGRPVTRVEIEAP
jgi:zeaxanthin glucosyltransferase